MSVKAATIGFSVCLYLTLSCLEEFARAQTCHSTDLDRTGTCSASELCRPSHPSEEESCTMNQNEPSTYIPGEGLSCSQQCAPLNSTDSLILRENPIMNLTVNLYSINRQLFGINISWTQDYNPTGGYELRILIDDNDESLCRCYSNPDLRQLYINFDDQVYRYGNSHDKITVELKMRSPDADVSMSEDIPWPSSCLDVSHNSSSCGLPVYPPPTNVTASIYYPTSSSENATLNVSWSYYTEYVYPTVYYIALYHYDPFALVVAIVTNNTNSVQIEQLMLNQSLIYSLDITAYVQCSGLADPTNNHLGCSRRASISEFDIFTMTERATTISTTTNITKATQLTNPSQGASYTHILVSGSVAGLAVIVTLTIAILILVIKAFRKNSRMKLSPEIALPITDASVFVVHTPQAKKMIDIQTYIVLRLKEYFDHVSTSGDFTRGDIIERIEAEEQKADAVLLVVTEEFHSEWESTERSHVVKAIQRLLTSAVSHDTLDKYAIVLLDEESKIFIPENNYLKSMNSYVLGTEERDDNMDALYRYVTKSKMFYHE